MKTARESNYDGAFPSRLRKLMAENKKSQTQLAKDLGITRQAVSTYMLGTTMPDMEKFVKISEIFSVSLEYLCGKTNNKTQAAANIGDITGLSDKSIKNLNCLKCSADSGKWVWSPIILAAINALLENEDSAVIREAIENGEYAHNGEESSNDSTRMVCDIVPGQNIFSLLAAFLASKPTNIGHYIDLYGNIYQSLKENGKHMPVFHASNERLIESITLDKAIEGIKKIKADFNFKIPPNPQLQFYEMTLEEIREEYGRRDNNADNPETR